jgi:hypothetical protein
MVISIRFVPRLKRGHVSGSDLFVIRKRAQNSVVESSVNERTTEAEEVADSQVSLIVSRREDTRSPVRNGASLRQSLIVSCYN